MTILYISQIFNNNECSDRVWFDNLEMHTNKLDLYLIGIVSGWVFDSKSVNVAIYLSTVTVVCIGKYREVPCNESVIDTPLSIVMIYYCQVDIYCIIVYINCILKHINQIFC